MTIRIMWQLSSEQNVQVFGRFRAPKLELKELESRDNRVCIRFMFRRSDAITSNYF